MAERWRKAAATIGFAESMDSAVDLSFEQYAALHDGRRVDSLKYAPRNEFVIEHVGQTGERHFANLGIEYNRYAG